MFICGLSVYMDRGMVGRVPCGFSRPFHRDTCCVTEHLLYLVDRKIDGGNIAKIHLDLTSDAPRIPERSWITEGRSSVQSGPWYFDFDGYVLATDVDKKLRVLATVEDAFTWIGGMRGWELDPFRQAVATIRAKNCEFICSPQRRWSSPNRKWRAGIVCNFEREFVHVFAVLYRRGDEVETTRQWLGKVVPEMGCIGEIIHKPWWEPNGVFHLDTAGFWREHFKADFSQWMSD